MINRYAAAILGSIGTATVLASYVVMYNDGQGAITLGLLGFALIGSAMLTQRVRDLTWEVNGLELERDYHSNFCEEFKQQADDLQRDCWDRWEDIHRLRLKVRDLKQELCDADSEAGAQRLKIENLEWQITHAQCVKGPLFCDGTGSCEWAEWSATEDGTTEWTERSE